MDGLTASTSFELFFDAVWPDLVAFCTQATGSPHRGEELCQDAMTRVYGRYPLLREPRPATAIVAPSMTRNAAAKSCAASQPDLPVTALRRWAGRRPARARDLVDELLDDVLLRLRT